MWPGNRGQPPGSRTFLERKRETACVHQRTQRQGQTQDPVHVTKRSGGNLRNKGR